MITKTILFYTPFVWLRRLGEGLCLLDEPPRHRLVQLPRDPVGLRHRDGPSGVRAGPYARIERHLPEQLHPLLRRRPPHAKDWDLQHDIMARGSFLVSREGAKVMLAQKMGGDIIYISSKNAVFAGPNNVAYGSTKADQAHQVRLLAAELGEFGIRVNGINPDGVVQGSGIFASGWGANRAAVYGVEESKLGEFYAKRTILKKEVLPDHIAAAVFVLLGGDLSLTTGLHIPVDGGVAAAFLR